MNLPHHPILMSAEMVRAIFEGRKTETRRPLNPQPRKLVEFLERKGNPGMKALNAEGKEQESFCPYGPQGELLWVRETWCVDADLDEFKPSELSNDTPVHFCADGEPPSNYGKKRAAIHLPLVLARLWLSKTHMPVIEPLQSITAEAVLREGIREVKRGRYESAVKRGRFHYTPHAAFRELWDSIYQGGTAWVANPWVYSVRFEQVERPNLPGHE